MSRRLWTFLALPLLLGACGQQPVADIHHPTGRDDVVLKLTDGPGMGTAQTFFSAPPVLVVTGDGTTYLRGEEVTAQGIVWPVFRYRASESEVALLLHEADHDGLLAPPPDYSPSSPVADGGDTTVTITTGAGTWTHRANGLDDPSREGGARGRLADFVAYLERWGRTPGRPAAREIRPTALRVLAQPAAPDPARGPVSTWPTAAGIDLAGVGDCAVVRDPVAVRRLTTSEDQYYRQSDETFELAAAVLLPGDSCESGPAS